MLRAGRRGLTRLGVKSPQLSLNGFTSQRGVSILNGNGHGLQSSQSHSQFPFTKENDYFTFGGSWSYRALSRSFTAGASGNTMDKNENVNEVATNDLKLKEDAEKWLEKRKMDQHWESVALWWDTNVGYAKKGERERMENNLKEECGMTQSKAEATAQWFLDNFKETQETPKDADGWKTIIDVCFADEAKFSNQIELMRDIANGGVITPYGENREFLIHHLLKQASKFNEKRYQSPYSSIVSGPPGIGKTMVQKEVGKRIPLLYPNIAVCYFPVQLWDDAAMSWPSLAFDLLPYIKEKSGKELVMMLLDDSDSIFTLNGPYAQSFVAGVSGLIPPQKEDVLLQIFGSSQVLSSLFRRSMDIETAKQLGFLGYARGTGKINDQKLPLELPSSPQTKSELTQLGEHIAAKNGTEFNDSQYKICSFFFGGVARSVELYLSNRNIYTMLQEYWDKLSKESKQFYFDFANKHNLTGKIKTWDDIELFMLDNDAFEWLRKCISSDDPRNDITEREVTNLLANGQIQKLKGGGVVPTRPICVLLASILQNEFWNDNLVMETLMDPLLTKNEVSEEKIDGLAKGKSKNDLQKLRIMEHLFSDKTILGGQRQCDLALKLSPLLLKDGKTLEKSKYHGVLSVDILNFGAINSSLSRETADEMVGEFGDKYYDLCKKYHNSENMEYCNVFHIHGDEFCFICSFNDISHFEAFTSEVAHIHIVKRDNEYDRDIPCYGRTGGVFTTIDNTINDCYELASDVEYSIKDNIARHLGYAKHTEMKNLTKEKGAPIKFIQDFDVLWKVEPKK